MHSAGSQSITVVIQNHFDPSMWSHDTKLVATHAHIFSKNGSTWPNGNVYLITHLCQSSTFSIISTFMKVKGFPGCSHHFQLMFFLPWSSDTKDLGTDHCIMSLSFFQYFKFLNQVLTKFNVDLFSIFCYGEKKRDILKIFFNKVMSNSQCISKVSPPLTFLQIFKYISSWDNTDKMTLWHNEK